MLPSAYYWVRSILNRLWLILVPPNRRNWQLFVSAVESSIEYKHWPINLAMAYALHCIHKAFLLSVLHQTSVLTQLSMASRTFCRLVVILFACLYFLCHCSTKYKFTRTSYLIPAEVAPIWLISE